jgi:hypothetical protein
MKKIIIGFLLLFFSVDGYSQQDVIAKDVYVKGSISNFKGEILIAPFSGSGNYFKNIRRATDSLDAVPFIQLQETVLGKVFEKELSEDENNISIGFEITETSLIYFNGSLIKDENWSGIGTVILHLNFSTKLYDLIKIKK